MSSSSSALSVDESKVGLAAQSTKWWVWPNDVGCGFQYTTGVGGAPVMRVLMGH